MKRWGHRSYFRNACPRYVLIVFFNKLAHKIFETGKPSKIDSSSKIYKINITETSTLFITKGYSGLLKFSHHTIDVTIQLTYMTSLKMLLLLTASVLSF